MPSEKDKDELKERRLLEKVDGRIETEHEKNTKRFALKPVEWIVYGMVASILMFFLSSVLEKTL